MDIKREMVVGKLTNYLENRISLAELVNWAEEAIREGDFLGDEDLRNIVARIGLADVKAFGLEWEEHKEMLEKLGYKAQVVVHPQP